jgi:hypothetical protein
MPRLAVALLLVAGIAAAAHAQQTDPAKARAKELKDGVKSFRLELNYNGDADKPFYRLTLGVPPSGPDRSNPFHRPAQVSEEQAGKIIDHLAQEGFLTKAVDLREEKVSQPTMPGYALKVGNFYQDLGWGLPMLKRLDGLRKMLDGDAAKGMDFLLGRLSGFRKQWEKATPPPAQQVQSVTDPASGVTVAFTGDGNELTATKNGQVVWKTRWTGPGATTLTLEAGVVVVSPGNSGYDPATGRLLWKKP